MPHPGDTSTCNQRSVTNGLSAHEATEIDALLSTAKRLRLRAGDILALRAEWIAEGLAKSLNAGIDRLRDDGHLEGVSVMIVPQSIDIETLRDTFPTVMRGEVEMVRRALSDVISGANNSGAAGSERGAFDPVAMSVNAAELDKLTLMGAERRCRAILRQITHGRITVDVDDAPDTDIELAYDAAEQLDAAFGEGLEPDRAGLRYDAERAEDAARWTAYIIGARGDGHTPQGAVDALLRVVHATAKALSGLACTPALAAAAFSLDPRSLAVREAIKGEP